MMRGVYAIASRELGSYFRTSAGWVIIALFLLLSGLVFAFFVFTPGQPASLRPFFAAAGWILLPVVPAISMRLISEELRSGTIESLLTAPLAAPALVLGKFLGAAMFLLAMVAPTLIYVVLLQRVANPPPDLGPIVSGYLCLSLLGMMYLAIGTFASSLTSNATLAFMVTLFTILGLLFLASTPDQLPPILREAAMRLSPAVRITDFARGVIDTGNVVYFFGMTAWFLLLAIASMELRRWR